MNQTQYVVYICEDNEYEQFDTFEEAQKYFDNMDHSEGYSEDEMTGGNFIAKITHRSKFVETDRKENYHEHTNNCPVDCDLEEWPYDSDNDCVGDLIMSRVTR
jgi:hypothetical protein